jgi:hypothetical protein
MFEQNMFMLICSDVMFAINNNINAQEYTTSVHDILKWIVI